MPLVIEKVEVWFGVTDPSLNHSQTLKDSTTQLLRSRSGVFVTQHDICFAFRLCLKFARVKLHSSKEFEIAFLEDRTLCILIQ